MDERTRVKQERTDPRAAAEAADIAQRIAADVLSHPPEQPDLTSRAACAGGTIERPSAWRRRDLDPATGAVVNGQPRQTTTGHGECSETPAPEPASSQFNAMLGFTLENRWAVPNPAPGVRIPRPPLRRDHACDLRFCPMALFWGWACVVVGGCQRCSRPLGAVEGSCPRGAAGSMNVQVRGSWSPTASGRSPVSGVSSCRQSSTVVHGRQWSIRGPIMVDHRYPWGYHVMGLAGCNRCPSVTAVAGLFRPGPSRCAVSVRPVPFIDHFRAERDVATTT